VPFAMPVLRHAYDFLARHRHCSTGSCSLTARPQ
jgi:hypothetical protein